MSNKKYQVGHVTFRPCHIVEPCDAISLEAMPGAKAGNTLVDEMNEQLKREEIIKKMRPLHRIIRVEMPRIRQDIEDIVKNHIDSKKQIEELLDTLLSYLSLGYGEEEFKRLNDYYFSINKKNSRAYSRFYEQAVRE